MTPDFMLAAGEASADLLSAMSTHKIDPWLTAEEAGEIIGRSPATLKAWRRKGWGPEFFRYGRSGVRYRLSAVEAWSGARATVR